MTLGLPGAIDRVSAGQTTSRISTATRSFVWLRDRWPELAVVLFGLVLRISMAKTYDVHSGYDFDAHYGYLRYIVEHHALPRYDLNSACYHPPLYYWLAALLERAGVHGQGLIAVSIASACLQLVLLWVGLALYLPRWRLAHFWALLAAAVVPASVQLAGLVSNEPLSAFSARRGWCCCPGQCKRAAPSPVAALCSPVSASVWPC